MFSRFLHGETLIKWKFSFSLVDYRGEKIAAFMIGGKTMLCLPQAFELFLKNLGMLWPVLIRMHSQE
jgi:hypothetical protein